MKPIRKILNWHCAFGALLVVGAVAGGAPARTVSLPDDTPTTVDGIEAVCTGVAMEPRDLLRWNKYPLKIVVAGKGGQFLAGEEVTVTQGEREIVRVVCDGPWVLFRLAPGEYRVRATLEGESAEASVKVPTSGQGRVTLRFPHLGGEISPQHTPGND